MTQEELDAMEISFKYHGFTWNQTNFAVAVIRSHVEPLRQQLAEANRKIEYEQLCASELEQQLDAANTLINKYREETTSLRQQIASSQKREVMLRGYLENIAFSRVGNCESIALELFNREALAAEAVAATAPKP